MGGPRRDDSKGRGAQDEDDEDKEHSEDKAEVPNQAAPNADVEDILLKDNITMQEDEAEVPHQGNVEEIGHADEGANTSVKNTSKKNKIPHWCRWHGGRWYTRHQMA